MAEIKGDKLVNKVIFQVDNTSFNNCLNKIRKLKAEMKSFSKSCGSMGKGFGGFNVIGQQAGKVAEKMARAQARMRATTVKQMTAQNKELGAMRKYYREQELLSARAAKQAAGIQASRRVQAVAGLTAKNPELEKMRAFYQQEAKASSRMGAAAVAGAAGRKNKILATNERMTGMFDGKVVAQFQRRMQSLNAKYKQGSISLGQYNARMAILRKEMAATAATAQRMQSSLNFNGFASGVQSLNAKVNSLLKGIAGLGMAGGYALQRMISGSMDAASIQNKTYFGLLSQNNDDKAATTRQMDFINRMSNVYGMDKAKVSTDYMKFAGSTRATMGEDQRQQLFEALNIKGTSYGITGEQFSLAAKALEQMSSKGRVAAEELRSQIGDHLPGAVQDFYEAWKKSEGKATATMADFEKAMKNGDVKLEKISGALAEIWGQAKNTQAFAQAMNTPERALQRMQNSLFDLKVAFIGTVDPADNVTTLAEHLINIFNHLSMVFGTSGEDATQFGSKVGEVLEGLVVDAEIIAFKIGDVITWLRGVMDEYGVTIKDVIEWTAKLVLGIKALNIAVSVTSALWKFYGVLKALGLLGQRFGNGGGVGGGPGGGNGPKMGGKVDGQVALIQSTLEAHEKARAKYYAENPDAGNVDLTSIRSWIPKPLLGWWDHGTATGKFPDWFPGQGQAITAPLSGWRDASLSTRLPTAPATVRAGNKVQINQQQVIKFDDNKLEGLIRVVSSEVTASSMGDMIDLINGGTESTRE
ncbi:TPA: tape measure protein [Escherichia coli]|nr:tape measure protein [Escherichia coli]